MNIRRVVMLSLAVLAVTPAQGAQEEPSLDEVLRRAASYVGAFNQQLSGIVAEETYFQEVTTASLRGMSAPVRSRRLKSDLLLVRPENTDRYIEFRDVFEVDGRAVRGREDRLSRLFLQPAGFFDQVQAIVEESARYNIGNIPRNVNTPMLTLVFLQPSYQLRFRFTRSRDGAPELQGLGGKPIGDAANFRVATDLWVIDFKETGQGTVIRTPEGRDFPAAGRYWIDPVTGEVRMSELVMDSGDVRAVIDVSYQSEPLLGLRVPIEMRERYRARSDRVEGIATYGRFRRFQVRTDADIAAPAPDPPAKKPPPQR